MRKKIIHTMASIGKGSKQISMLVCFFVIGLTFNMSAQTTDSLPLNKDFEFTNGLYKDVAQLRTNQPEVLLKHLSGSLVFMENDYLLKIEKLYPQGHPEMVYDLTEIEVVTYQGLPFFKVAEDSLRGYTSYAGLRVRGRLSYFSYEYAYQDSVMIKAYNPATGRPFRQQKVATPKVNEVRKVINIATGESLDFELENMYLLLADDPSLINTLKSLSPAEAREKMERFLLIYDDRNPLYLPQTKIND